MTAAIRSSSDPVSTLKKEFSAVGLKPKSAFDALPEWWEEAVTHPSGVFEIKGFAAKYFGLEIGPDGRLRQRTLPHACFKTRSGTDVSEVASARAVATAVAKLVAGAATVPWEGSLPQAGELRHSIIEGNGRPWVGLPDLLSVCWERGIPVIYLPDIPVAKAKTEGMVTICGGRPVILVTKRASHVAWMLFLVAHEMGHIASGHLSSLEGGAIVDEHVSEEAGVDDDEEREANAYALQLLTGGQRAKLALTQLVRADAFAIMARQYGAEHQIDPGHVVLNAISNSSRPGKNLWPLGNAALKHIDHEAGPAFDLCRTALRRYIDTDLLTDDGFEFLERLGVL